MKFGCFVFGVTGGGVGVGGLGAGGGLGGLGLGPGDGGVGGTLPRQVPEVCPFAFLTSVALVDFSLHWSAFPPFVVASCHVNARQSGFSMQAKQHAEAEAQ